MRHRMPKESPAQLAEYWNSRELIASQKPERAIECAADLLCVRDSDAEPALFGYETRSWHYSLITCRSYVESLSHGA